MDVDYCFEARLHGFVLVQVPVALQHEESRTTRVVAGETPELWRHLGLNMDRFLRKWQPFHHVMPTSALMTANSYCSEAIAELNGPVGVGTRFPVRD
jgi:hypothetical protein